MSLSWSGIIRRATMSFSTAPVRRVFGPGTSIIDSANQTLNAWRRNRMTAALEATVRALLAGDRRILAKTITLVESSLACHQGEAQEILEELLPHGGTAIRLGITGVPGVGKSTFIDSLGMLLVEKGHRVAVLAVDPSSIRAVEHPGRQDPHGAAFRRPAGVHPASLPAVPGGVARKTRESMLVCEAAGFDVIMLKPWVSASPKPPWPQWWIFPGPDAGGRRRRVAGHQKGFLEFADAWLSTRRTG